MPRRSDLLVFLALAGSPLPLLAGLWFVAFYVLGLGWTPPEPPGGTLTVGDERRRGVGTVGCWTEKMVLLPHRSACVSTKAGAVDRGGRLVEALTVSRGDAVLFEYGGASAPEKVGARITRQGVPLDIELAGKQDRMMQGRDGAHFPTPGTKVETIEVERVRDGAAIPVNPAPGRYLLMVSVRVDDETARGEAFYDFNVVVR